MYVNEQRQGSKEVIQIPLMERFGTEVNRRYCHGLLKNETERFHYSCGMLSQNTQKLTIDISRLVILPNIKLLETKFCWDGVSDVPVTTSQTGLKLPWTT
ncbi:hypothetical protein AV530_011925 [Patagioenas fasciata monilis]|uniref:Uncharacterized protein n=1 Tax=Patagioenas fasciata monilis TaxID=372326 RepID=A0A1V4JVQ1_PATFA|nr:hypothetical protein AV530_011925 [Patagioenas fasciata monilis]